MRFAARRDVWPATLLYVFSFWIVMVPLGYWLAVPRGMGAYGLMVAVAAGATLAAVLLGWRFRVVSAPRGAAGVVAGRVSRAALRCDTGTFAGQ